ncbi:MAG TPA: MBL fold metallo-hydrolase [Xanthobacteraceae bacterium]|nr:MBL fold metallo-hydrolase [Xanthobacteraceae bacterium]
MGLTVTILGCGSSGGVPRIAQGWGACDPANPKNRRRRCSILVERENAGKKTSVLVDTSPDLRDQLLSANVTHLDGVIYTHDHADHTHGIDDLRPLSLQAQKRTDVYVDETTSRSLHTRFGYCFATPKGSDYPPILIEHRIAAGKPLRIEGEGGAIEFVPFDLIHGETHALGLRFGGFAYCPDVSDVPPESLGQLEGLDVWIIDALRRRPHPSHFSLTDALQWIARMRPKRAVLTNMHNDLDYETLRGELGKGIEPAFDGMKIQ